MQKVGGGGYGGVGQRGRGWGSRSDGEGVVE